MLLRYLLIALLCPCLLNAQTFAGKPLTIGDQVPDIEFPVIINHKTSSARLSDFKGKLVILDFWATWCTSCLQGFPKLDSLQKFFENDLKIFLVNSKETRDNLQKVSLFYKNWELRTGKNLDLPSVVEDTIAKKLFQPRLIPHYVWIGQDGKLIAFTSVEEVTAKNIRAVLNGEVSNLKMKKDQDVSQPLFTSNALPAEDLLYYSIFLKGQFDGLPGGERFRYTNNVAHGLAMTNSSLLNMYKRVVFSGKKEFHTKQIILDMQDSSGILPPKNSELIKEWNKVNLYSFDFIMPVAEAPHLYEKAMDMLNEQSGYVGYFENRKIECLVLKRKGWFNKVKPERSNDPKETLSTSNKRITMPSLMRQLNGIESIDELIINEAGFNGKINFKFPDDMNNLESMQQQLSSYGLKLKVVKRVIEIFVLKKLKDD